MHSISETDIEWDRQGMSCGVVKDNQLLPGIIRNVFSDNI